MTISRKVNLENPASIRRKISEFVSKWTILELIRDIFQNSPKLLRRLLGLYFDKGFDKKYNVDTCGSIPLHELTINSKNAKSGVIYDPVPIKTLRYVFSSISINFSEYTFIDFGSGKGRIILTASEYPFHQITGVEFATELHKVAIRNIASYTNSKQKCFDIQSIHTDAVDFEIPQMKCLFFFYAPFAPDIFLQVLENIKQSYLQHPREMLILYITDPISHPISSDEIKESGFKQVRAEFLPFDIAQRQRLYYELYEI